MPPDSVPLTQPGEPTATAVDSVATHPFDVFRCAVVVALGLPYGTGEMFGGYRYPTDAEIVSWVEDEHARVKRMHDGHHTGVEGFCPACGVYGKGATAAARSGYPTTEATT